MYRKNTFKMSRRLGFSILETGKEFSKGKKRTYGPGEHGQGRKKFSNYAIQLKEKQKLRFMYGVDEKQFRRIYKKATKMSGVTGENFLNLLESRLDNLVYRLKWAKTRKAARQLVSHGHITLNHKKVNIPSIVVKVGDKIGLRSTSTNLKIIKEAIESEEPRKDFVQYDDKKKEGSLKRLPDRKELNQEINENLIVEWYNKLM